MKKEIKPSYLILSLHGPEKAGLFHALTKLCKTCQCLILESHATQMGDHLGMVLRLSGHWNAMAKFETQFPLFQKKWECQAVSQRIDAIVPNEDRTLAYNMQAISFNTVDVIPELLKFFHQRKIKLLQLNSETYHTSRSSTPLCAITAVALIPHHLNIATLREQFMVHCEEYNLDAILEPQKLA